MAQKYDSRSDTTDTVAEMQQTLRTNTGKPDKLAVVRLELF